MTTENDGKTKIYRWWFFGGMVLYLLALLFVIVAYIETSKQEVKQLGDLKQQISNLKRELEEVKQKLKQ